MKPIPLKSSNLQSVTYDHEKQTLRIAFGNATYEFTDVPRNVYNGLLLAPSPGSYFHREIKSRFKGMKLP